MCNVAETAEDKKIARINELRAELLSLGYQRGGRKPVIRTCPTCGKEFTGRQWIGHDQKTCGEGK